MEEIWVRETAENGKPINIDGTFCVFRNGKPLQVTLPASPARSWITIFSTLEKLVEQMAQIKVEDFGVKTVTDGEEFAASARESGVGIMYDPHVVDGNTRWKEIK